MGLSRQVAAHRKYMSYVLPMGSHLVAICIHMICIQIATLGNGQQPAVGRHTRDAGQQDSCL